MLVSYFVSTIIFKKIKRKTTAELVFKRFRKPHEYRRCGRAKPHLVFKNMPGDVAEFERVHVVILRDRLPYQFCPAGGLARDKALASEASKEIVGGIRRQLERRVSVADSVAE